MKKQGTQTSLIRKVNQATPTFIGSFPRHNWQMKSVFQDIRLELHPEETLVVNLLFPDIPFLHLQLHPYLFALKLFRACFLTDVLPTTFGYARRQNQPKSSPTGPPKA